MDSVADFGPVAAAERIVARAARRDHARTVAAFAVLFTALAMCLLAVSLVAYQIAGAIG